MNEYSSILDAVDNHNRIILLNSLRQEMCIICYDSHEYESDLWNSKITLFKEGVECGSIVKGSYKKWFIDDNHQICIIP